MSMDNGEGTGSEENKGSSKEGQICWDFQPSRRCQTYGRSKRCRLGLIDFALSHSKHSLNMFKQDPLSGSKLICKLTGYMSISPRSISGSVSMANDFSIN